jgi:hypothetical protein
MNPDPSDPSDSPQPVASAQAAPVEHQPGVPEPQNTPPGAQPAADQEKPSWTHARTGNVARLPKAVRDQINIMIEDGVPFAKIIEKIGDAGNGLRESHITSWKAGGNLDWLAENRRVEALSVTRDAALDLVNQKAGATVQDAGRTVAAAQLYELLLSFDPTSFAAALSEKPELYLRLINSLTRLSEGEAGCSRLRAQASMLEGHLNAADNGDGRVVIPREKLDQLIRLIKLL